MWGTGRWIAGGSSQVAGRRKQALHPHLLYGHLHKLDAKLVLRDCSPPLYPTALCNNGFASYERTASRCALGRSCQRLRLLGDARTRVGCSPSSLANCLQPDADRVITPGTALHIAHLSRPCSYIIYVPAHAAHICLCAPILSSFSALPRFCCSTQQLFTCMCSSGVRQPPHPCCT